MAADFANPGHDAMNETLRPPSTSDAPGSSTAPREPSGSVVQGTRFRVGAVIAILAVVGIVVWLALSGGEDDTRVRNPNAVETTVEGLSNLAVTLNQPIYWAGPEENVKYELVRRDDQILVGYISAEEEVGNASPHPVVGTYKIADAFAVTQQEAERDGRVRFDAGEGAVAFYNESYPLSAFVAFPGSQYQIEVFDPTPERARELISSGRIVPVPGSPAESPAAQAVTPRQLAARAAEAGQPIYWAGRPEPGGTLELARTSQGWFVVRYLPPGAPVGDGDQHLSVSTYPVPDALAAVQRLAGEPGAETIELDGGGLAVVNAEKFPNSVFVAFPGVDYQIEVFAPTLDEAREAVESGRIAAAG